MKMTSVWLMASLTLLALPAFGMQPDGGTFTPEAGFGGASEGNGTLKLFFGSERPFHVESHGQRLADGTFQLDQTVLFGDKPPRRRRWSLTTVQPNLYSGSLSDAAGTVSGHTDGSRLIFRYRLKGPLVMHQMLEMMPDGTIDNVGRITFIGIPVGHLHETIVRKPSVTE